ncbi:MAG TPA: exopolysaccharide biosynthesis protein [Myxococcota bacterium]|nr:exopolysaccharide biosynthesis protein [Myxococcota bacterium]
MREPPNVTDLETLLDRIEQAVEGDRVSLREIFEMVGRRSFGPLLLLAGLVTVSPGVGDVPGVPTIFGIFVVLISVQLLLHRDHFWLPDWLLRRSVSKKTLCKALGWMRRPARAVDRVLRPRLVPVTQAAGHRAIAAMCLAIGLAMPAMEIVPLSANGAGAALTGFGLALIAQDGLVAIVAFAASLVTFGAVAYGLS